MFALDSQLNSIMAEGLETRFNRHRVMAERVQRWAKENFSLFPEEQFASPTVTCIKNIHNLDVGQFNKKLDEAGFVISNGYEKLKDKTFRIAHMGDTSLEDIEELLQTIDYLLTKGDIPTYA